MQKKNSPIERFLALMLSVLMVFSLMPTTAFATDGVLPAVESKATQCHAKHDTDCGYVQAVDGAIAIEGVPCDNGCEGAHIEGCAFKEAVALTPVIVGASCTHTCNSCAAPSNEALSNVAKGASLPQPIAEYFVKFEPRNGEYISGVKVDTTTNTALLPKAPTWANYTFSGWYTDIDGTGVQIDDDTVHTEGITVYAKWVKYDKTVRTMPLDFTLTSAPVPDQGWAWDGASKTLTLTDATIIAENDHAINLPDGATVILQGINSLVTEGLNNSAINSSSNFTISGDGTLYAKGTNSGILSSENVTINNGAIIIAEGRAYGISISKILTINDSTLTATSTSTKTDRNGLLSHMADIIINNSTVNATGKGSGISALKNIKITDSTVNAVGNNALSTSREDITITNSVVNAKGTDNGVYASRNLSITSSKVTGYAVTNSVAGEAIGAYDKFIAANGATATGATEPYINGTTKVLLQADMATPVVMTFGPYIEVMLPTSNLTYGTAASSDFVVNATDFDGTKAPAFAPSIEWKGGTTPTGVVTTFSNNNATLNIATSATIPAGVYKFKILSAKKLSTGGNHESKDVTLTIAKANPTVKIDVTKKLIAKGRAVIGSKEDTFIITATVTGANGEKPAGKVQFKTSNTSNLSPIITLTDGVATYEWVKPAEAIYTITANYTATTSNYNNATSSTVPQSVIKITQDELKFKDVPSSVHSDFGKINFVTEGGSGTGATSYASSNTAVIDIDGKVKAAGTATITATKTGDNDYLIAKATINITVTTAEPYFDGNDLFAVGEPILLINENGTVNAYWDKNSNGVIDINDTKIVTQATTGEHGEWNIYGASKYKAMTATSTSQITLYSVGFNAINAGSKLSGDATADQGVTRLLRVATTETIGAISGFNKTEYKINLDLQSGSYATAFAWQPENAPLVTLSGAAPTKADSTFMGFFDASDNQYYRENLKTGIVSFTANATLTLNAKWSEGKGIFAGRYSHFQVFDCSREPAFPAKDMPFRAFNLGVPYNDVDGSGFQMNKTDVKGKIFYFKKTSNDDKPFILYMADDIDGKNEKAISREGRIYALGKEGLLFISYGSEKGYFISLAQGLEYGDEITYSPTQAGPVSEDVASKHPDTSPTPWNPNESYAIVFNSQGANTLAMPSQMAIRNNPAPAQVGILPADPVKEGNLFGGWFPKADGTGTEITINTILTTDITAYAKWKFNVEYVNVTLTNITNLEPSKQFGTGTGIKNTAWTGVVLPKSGYKLPDGIIVTVEGTTLAANTDYTYSKATGEISINKDKMTANVEIAITASSISYTVKYHANGAAGEPSITQQNITFGTNVNVATKGNMISSWTFKGWARTGDATLAEYAENAVIDATNPVTLTDGATVSLYAVWDANGANVTLQNGSFEKPIVQSKTPWTNFINGAIGLEWKTTSKDGKHEIVRPSINPNSTNGAFNTRVASEGEQFAELNANFVGSLYQDVQTIPGSTLYWGADHRGRGGADTMQVWIGSPADIATALDQYVKGGNDVTTVDSTLLGTIKQMECKSDNKAWKNYEAAYTVPVGQNTTTFAFVSVASANGVVSYGNLLDNIYFSFVKPPKREGVIVRTTTGGSVTVSDGSMTSTVVSDPKVEYARSLEYGNVLKLGVQAAAGYSFNGGYINGVYYHTKADFLNNSNNMSWTVDADLPDDITILFSKNSTVIFAAQGGTHDKAEVTLTASSPPEVLGTPTKNNNKFGGWLIAGTETVLRANDTIEYFTNAKTGLVSLQVSTNNKKLSFPVANGIILIAQWSYDDSYLTEVTVKLDYDDGATVATEQTLNGTTTSLSLPAPTNPLYRFIGWRYPMGVVDEPYVANTQMKYEQNGSSPRVYIGTDINVALEEMLLIAQWVPRQATKVAIKDKPKTSYEYSDGFDPTLLVVTVTYDNGTTQDVPYLSNESMFTFTPNTANKLTLTDKKVTITFTEADKAHELELPISVVAKKLTVSVTNVDAKIYDGNTSTTSGKIDLTGVAVGDTVTASGHIKFTDKNVGTNKMVNVTNIALSGANASNYVIADTSIANAATTAEITPKHVTITWNGTANRVYDGQKSGVYATATNVIPGDVCNVSVTDGNATNAGTYTATASVDNTNYIINGSNSTDYTIEKAELVATYEGATVIYQTKMPSEALKVSVTGFVNGETAATLNATDYTAPTVSVADWNSLTVGKHKLTPSGGSATNYNFAYVEGQLNVIARDFDAVIIQDYIGDYDGAAHTLKIVNVDNTAADLTITYYPTKEDATEGTKGTTAPTQRTDAGTTTVFYKVEATGFTSQVGEGTITINKKPVTAVIDAQAGKLYDGTTAANGVTLKLNGVIGTDDAKPSGSIVFTDKNVGSNKTVFASGLTIVGGKKDNYILTATAFTANTAASITPKLINLTWTNDVTLIYTGVAKNVGASISAGDVAAGDVCNVSVTGGNAKNYQAGGYTATATITNDNYAIINPTHTYNIAQAQLNATFKSVTIVYGDTPTLEVEVTGFVGGETALTAFNYKAPTIKTTIPTAVSANPYAIELNNDGAADNYSFNLLKGKLTINKADMSQNVSATGYTGAYDGASHGITVTAPAGSTIEYSDNQATPNTSNSYVNAGTYEVSYTVSHDNYATVKGTATVAISKKQLIPTFDPATVQSKTYDKNNTATVSGTAIMLTGILDQEIVTADANVTFTDVNIGSKKRVTVTNIMLTGAAKDNYALSTTSIPNVATTAEIAPLEVILAWSPSPANYTYDGNEKSVVATVSNLIQGDNCQVAITNGSATIPGAYTAIARSLSNTNYKLPTANTHLLTIKNATIIGIVVTPTIKNYDGIFSDGVTVTNQRPSDKVFYSTGNANGPWSEDIPQVGYEGVVTNIWVKVERKYHDPFVHGHVQATVKATPKVKIDKPIFDAVNVKQVTVGGMVTPGANAIVKQSLSIRKAGETTYATLNVGAPSGNNTIYLQTLTNLTESTAYELLLTATDNQGVAASTTLSFRTQPKNPPIGAIEGGVTGGNGKITVTLEMGNTVVASIKDLNSNDKFTFKALEDGEYNVVATDALGRRVTMMASVKDGKTTTLAVMNIGLQQSAVEVKGNAPPVAVDGLQDLFGSDTYGKDTDATDAITNGGTVEIRLTANEAKVHSEINDIKAGVGSDTVSLIIDLKVDMIITPTGTPSTVKNLTSVEGLLTIAVPLPKDAIGKTGYRMYRHHAGSVEELKQLAVGDTPVEGSFLIDGAYAYVYSSKFSTYALTHTNPTSGGGGGGSYYNYHYINLNAGEGGSFIPTTSRYKIREGHTIGIDIVPNAGYEIENVIVNGTTVGAVKSYLVRNIREDYTISASFKKTTPPPINAGGGNAGTPSTNVPTNPNTNLSSSTPDKTKPSDDVVDYNPESLIKELEKKREETIANLPSTLTKEERKVAIDEINTIYDEASKAISNAKNIFEGSGLLNKAVEKFETLLAKYKAILPSTAPTGKSPFVLASALLALASIALAVLALFKRKEKEHKKRKLIIAMIGAVASVITFFLTSGWNGLVLANIWTLLILVFVALTAYGFTSTRSKNDQ